MEKPDALFQKLDHGNRFSNNENVVLLCPEFLAICAPGGVELAVSYQTAFLGNLSDNYHKSIL